MRAYITGICGLLGSHLADYLLAKGHDVTGCDDLSTGDADNVNDQILWQRQRIEDLRPEDLAGIDVVWHTAAWAYEGLSSFSPAAISQNIYGGAASVFSAAIAARVKMIVHCSSMARYGEPVAIARDRPVAFVEGLLPRPVDPYGIAKEASERLLINLCETHRSTEWAVAVPHNIYGPRQATDPYRNVATIFATRMLHGKQPIIYGDGYQMRCFSYIDDVVPSLARMGFDPAASHQIINLGPDRGTCSILDLARLLAQIIGVKCEPVFLPSRPREVRYAVCSADKARRLLGFEQRTELYNGLVKLVAWLKEKGTRQFRYHLPLEIPSALTPKTWTDQSM